jgi:hypothetical protein
MKIGNGGQKNKFSLVIFLFTAILIVSAIGLAGVSKANAQLPLNVEEPISFSILPSVPQPFDEIEARIESFFTDIDKATVSWYINGELIDSATGLKTLTFRAGDVGSTVNIRIVVNKAEGGTLEKTFSIGISDVDLFRVSPSFAHPFYEGKTLPAGESKAVFVAIPHFFNGSGQRISSENIVFTWEIDGTVDGRNSGAGRDTYSYQEDVITRPVRVSVEATPISSDTVAREIKTFEYVDPEIIFYESSPTLGTLYNRALNGDYELRRQEMEVTAIPYNFSLSGLGDMLFKWTLDGQQIQISDGPVNKLAFRKEEGASGTSVVRLSIENTAKILQAAEESFNLFYD